MQGLAHQKLSMSSEPSEISECEWSWSSLCITKGPGRSCVWYSVLVPTYIKSTFTAAMSFSMQKGSIRTRMVTGCHRAQLCFKLWTYFRHIRHHNPGPFVLALWKMYENVHSPQSHQGHLPMCFCQISTRNDWTTCICWSSNWNLLATIPICKPHRKLFKTLKGSSNVTRCYPFQVMVLVVTLGNSPRGTPTRNAQRGAEDQRHERAFGSSTSVEKDGEGCAQR